MFVTEANVAVLRNQASVQKLQRNSESAEANTYDIIVSRNTKEEL